MKKGLIRAINKKYEKELDIIDKDKSMDALDIGVYRGVYSYKLSQNFETVPHSTKPTFISLSGKKLEKIIKI